MYNDMYDVVIIGGSFAGLTTAMQLRGYRVLVIDQRPIGSHQASTCAIPLATMRQVGAEGSALESHDAILLHAGRPLVRFPLRTPFVTFDYFQFCQALLAQTEAEVWQAKVTGYGNGTVETTRGPVQARYIVDASGWQALARQQGQPARTLRTFGYGIETELPVRPVAEPGLHFYFEKEFIRTGYAWVFPCGATSRIGVCSFDQGVRLGPLLTTFLARFGLECGPTHGGVMAIRHQEPLAGEVFRVGDSAGQCLPMTAEGIRTAIYHGRHCGQALVGVLAGAQSLAQAQAGYTAQVARLAAYQQRLMLMQMAVSHTPEWLWAAAGWLCARPPVTAYMINHYLTHTGWAAG